DAHRRAGAVCIRRDRQRTAVVGRAPPTPRRSTLSSPIRISHWYKRLHHSGLMPDALITLAHLAASSAIYLANSSGELCGIAIAPSSASRALIVASAIAALNASLSRSTIGTGVFFGTPKPIQAVAS